MTSLPTDAGGDRAVAFVGVAKNSGKTTTLGRWIEEWTAAGRTVALASVGVDGETTDAILGVDKPAIEIPEGAYVATGAEALERSSARFEYLEALEFSTPLGRAYVARAVDGGDVLLGGLRHRADLLVARDRLRAAVSTGASGDRSRTLIDGAYGRTVAADGRVAARIVLSTGAVVGSSPRAIVRETEPLVDVLRLSAPSEAFEAAARRSEEEGRALFVTKSGSEPLPTASALRGLPRARDEWPDDSRGLVIPGAVTDRVVEELARVDGAGRTLVALAPASIQASDRAWRTFRETDWRVRLRHPVELAGIAANPVDPAGGSVDSTELVEALSERWPAVPVFDPCA